jgi:hypothetical protein
MIAPGAWVLGPNGKLAQLIPDPTSDSTNYPRLMRDAGFHQDVSVAPSATNDPVITIWRCGALPRDTDAVTALAAVGLRSWYAVVDVCLGGDAAFERVFVRDFSELVEVVKLLKPLVEVDLLGEVFYVLGPLVSASYGYEPNSLVQKFEKLLTNL